MTRYALLLLILAIPCSADGPRFTFVDAPKGAALEKALKRAVKAINARIAVFEGTLWDTKAVVVDGQIEVQAPAKVLKTQAKLIQMLATIPAKRVSLRLLSFSPKSSEMLQGANGAVRVTKRTVGRIKRRKITKDKKTQDEIIEFTGTKRALKNSKDTATQAIIALDDKDPDKTKRFYLGAKRPLLDSHLYIKLKVTKKAVLYGGIGPRPPKGQRGGVKTTTTKVRTLRDSAHWLLAPKVEKPKKQLQTKPAPTTKKVDARFLRAFVIAPLPQRMKQVGAEDVVPDDTVAVVVEKEEEKGEEVDEEELK